nr:MAG TPA: hypothetical protein [Caudoviricetes sp.]
MVHRVSPLSYPPSFSWLTVVDFFFLVSVKSVVCGFRRLLNHHDTLGQVVDLYLNVCDFLADFFRIITDRIQLLRQNSVNLCFLAHLVIIGSTIALESKVHGGNNGDEGKNLIELNVHISCPPLLECEGEPGATLPHAALFRDKVFQLKVNEYFLYLFLENSRNACVSTLTLDNECHIDNSHVFHLLPVEP